MNASTPASAARAEPIYVHVDLSRGEYLLSVIGSRPQLEALASGLAEALSKAPDSTSLEKPHALLVLPATGLVPKDPETELAFYLDSAKGYRPKPWFGRQFGSWWAFALAVIGLVAIVRTIYKLAVP